MVVLLLLLMFSCWNIFANDREENDETKQTIGERERWRQCLDVRKVWIRFGHRDFTSHSSADWKANRDLRRDHRRWWHTLLECTSYDCAMNGGLVYRWFQQRSLHWVNPAKRWGENAVATRALWRTCLLAKIRRTASRSSSSANMRWSSSRASPTRSRSLLSMTKIKPWVFWK